MLPSKILLVGSDFEWSLERIFLRHLNNAGANTTLFPAQNLFYLSYNKSVLHKLYYRAGFNGVLKRINELLMRQVEAEKPDIVWVFKGMEIFPETIDALSRMGCCVVNYNPDNPFVFSSSGSGNKNVRDSLPHFAAHITYDRIIYSQLQNSFKGPSYLIPFGFEPSTIEPDAGYDEDVLRVCFIGNGDPERAMFINSIARSLPVDVFGNGWNALRHNKNVAIHNPVYGALFPQTIRKYRVQLNLLRKHNALAHNMRSFEIPGLGGLGLFPETIDHVEYFEDHQLAITYKDVEDCIQKASAVLNAPAVEMKQRRMQLPLLSKNLGYDYKSRAAQILNIFSSLV